MKQNHDTSKPLDSKTDSTSRFTTSPIFVASQQVIDMLCFHILSRTPQEVIITIINTLKDAKINFNIPHSHTGATPLALAITMLLPKVVEKLLATGADSNLACGLKDKQGCLPLALALRKGFPSDAKTLYLKPPTATLTQREPQTSEVYQAERKKIIVTFLAHPHIDLTKKDDAGLDTFGWLLKLGCAVKDKDVYALFQDRMLTTINFFELIKNSSAKSAEADYKQLLKHIETNPDFLKSIDPITKHTPLGLAIKFLNPGLVALFLESKADPNQPTGKDKYHLPITIALSKSHATNDASRYITSSSPFVCPRLTLLGSKECGCPTDRDKIIQLLLDNTRLELNKLEKNGEQTILDILLGWDGPKKDSKHFLSLLEKGAKFANPLTTLTSSTSNKF